MNKTTILIVDDNQNNLFTLRTLIQDHTDVNVVEASSGEEALKKVSVFPVDLIILDIQLTGIDGFETASLIKQRKKTADIPIIFLTAEYITDEFEKKGFKIGAIDYLTKPIEEYQLVNKINLYLKLIEKNNELKRSNEELERFAYVISHDLQEPLRTVTSFAQLLEKRNSGNLDADSTDFIRRIVSGTIRMKNMIDDLLEYSRAGKINHPLEKVDSRKIIQRAIDNLKNSITENDAKITYEDLPVIYGDISQLIRLFQNLIGNAIKFHGNIPPEINISAKKRDHSTKTCDDISGKEWQFSIMDNGIGIESEFYDDIFEIFHRLNSQQQYTGTGIGLAICKRIVENHGGKIWVESKPGEGSVFHFTLMSI